MNSKYFILCNYRHTRLSDLNFEIRSSLCHILCLRKKMYGKMHQTVFAFSKFRGHSQKLSKAILEFNLPKIPLTTCFFFVNNIRNISVK